MESNTRIIESLYRHFSEKDLDAIAEIFDEDIQWKQMEGFPNGGLHIGFDAIVSNVFKQFSKDWTDWGAHVEEFLDAGNVIIAIGYYHGTYKETGKSVKAAFTHRYDLKNGKVTHFFQYTDTLVVAQAMGL